jgi:NADH-quinone oxidoreductase subunit A
MEIFVPLILTIGAILVVVLGMVGLNRLMAPHNPNPTKNGPFECGLIPMRLPEGRSFIRFYLIAILFILFDVELAFLFPWAVNFRKLGLAGFAYMMTFLIVLLAGFLYVWKRGALELE